MGTSRNQQPNANFRNQQRNLNEQNQRRNMNQQGAQWRQPQQAFATSVVQNPMMIQQQPIMMQQPYFVNGMPQMLAVNQGMLMQSMPMQGMQHIAQPQRRDLYLNASAREFTPTAT